ncbi:MAG: acetoacetate--CoA ligase [Candidatus Bathyarchaeota archaeon]|nr:acetoacetate--CoA ligase [Candidatus Bathyarchaeota archaeon]MDH5494327.1 acetoacetate--CoA ligase [Candidatus Bathyarchaeota archaeon]
MRKPLWVPSEERIKEANITRFINLVNGKYNLQIDSYDKLHRWSIENVSDFWAAMWEFGGIKASQKYETVVDDLGKFPGAKWFAGARLNFAENLLRCRDAHPAFIFKGETKKSSRMTYTELYNSVARLARSLRKMGVAVGDRVAAYMPNLVETANAMLATTSIGAIWSSCGTELGPKAVLDRFGQIEPKVLFTVDGYYYKGKTFGVLSRAEEVAKGISSVKKTIVFPYVEEKPHIVSIPNSVLYDDFVFQEEQREISFEKLPFDHPAYIMFSSGTTGKPKCMVQGAGGILINHLKELILHTDLKRDDRIFYIATPSWMMWNWLLGSLAVGATLVLYDGNPNYPDWSTMWRLVQDEKITIFGCSASYINYLKSVDAKPAKDFDLSSLREISQTGSPLSAEGFEYIYRKIKEDLHFNSISGGTDINGCFAAGTPIQPVYAGELQGPALGMNVKAYDEKGNSVVDQQGELVCEAPAPSMPLYFWNDLDSKRYRDAYFSIYSNVWRHGDWILIHSDTGGITFLGRSDFTLKPSGVRIGPSEIYNVVERFEEIADSMVVGQDLKGDQRIILFVKLASRFQLTDELKNKIRKTLRKEASPRHVPALIIETPDIPYTFSMKKVESAVSNIVNGRPVTNRDALVNPESLDFYERILSELQKG